MPPTAIQPFHGSYLMPAFERATVADAMHPGILSCHANAPLTDVARMMAGNHVHCVAVMTTTHEDAGATIVWGIISDLDLLRASVVGGRDDCAGSLAQQPVISVAPSLPLRQAGELMLTHHVSHLVVVDPDSQRPLGILSSLDLAGVLAWGEA